MNNLQRRILASLIILLVIFSGYSVAIYYRNLRQTNPVGPATPPVNSGGHLSKEQEEQEQRYIVEQIQKAKINQMLEKVDRTGQVLEDALIELELDLIQQSSEVESVRVYTDLEFGWTKQTGQIKVPTFVRHPKEIEEVKGKLITAAQSVGSQLMSSDLIEDDDVIQELIQLGFYGVDDVEIVTHQFVLSKVKPKGKLAFVIDDLGYHWSEFSRMMTIPRPMTFAVIPHLPRSTQQSERTLEEGYDLILHQPMEAVAALDPGEGAIYAGMKTEEINEILTKNLANLPSGIIGANNHMGSKATADRVVMEAVLKFMKENDLFFIDSNTSSDSVVAKVAEELEVDYAVNKIFLDNVDELEAIQIQIRKAANMALRQKEIIAIGHVRQFTARAILSMIDEIEAMGVQIVYAKDLLTRFE